MNNRYRHVYAYSFTPESLFSLPSTSTTTTTSSLRKLSGEEAAAAAAREKGREREREGANSYYKLAPKSWLYSVKTFHQEGEEKDWLSWKAETHHISVLDRLHSNPHLSHLQQNLSFSQFISSSSPCLPHAVPNPAKKVPSFYFILRLLYTISYVPSPSSSFVVPFLLI